MVRIRLGNHYHSNDFDTLLKTEIFINVMRIIKRDEKLFEKLTDIENRGQT